jgi:hypothetical protein
MKDFLKNKFMIIFKDKYGEWILYDPDLIKIPIFMVITSIDILYWWCNNI